MYTSLGFERIEKPSSVQHDTMNTFFIKNLNLVMETENPESDCFTEIFYVSSPMVQEKNIERVVL